MTEITSSMSLASVGSSSVSGRGRSSSTSGTGYATPLTGHTSQVSQPDVFDDERRGHTDRIRSQQLILSAGQEVSGMISLRSKLATDMQIVCRRALCTSPSVLPTVKTLEVSEPKPYVFHVKLNRPQQRNSFNADLWRELREVFDFLSSHSKCRAVVLSGAGKSFCAGIDLKEGLKDLYSVVQDESKDVARKARRIHDFIGQCQDSISSLERCDKPVIASVHGHCIGAGINLIASADIRYASSDAVFSIREAAIGIAADVGILNRINKLVGSDSLTRELTFTARDINAQQALDYGLISRQFPNASECLEASVSLASEIVSRSPIAVQGAKKALNYARDHSIEDSLNFIRVWNQSQLQSDDLMQAAMAAFSKENPKFEDV